MEGVYLKDILHVFCKEEVCNWDFLQLESASVRIYYKPNNEERTGFYFYAVEKTGHECNEITEKDEWHQDYCIVDCVFQGSAYFDGVRHLYYGDEKTDNFGYHYYPNLTTIANSLLKLQELEEKYCVD